MYICTLCLRSAKAQANLCICADSSEHPFHDIVIIIKVSKGAKIRNRYNQVPHKIACTDSMGFYIKSLYII